jgi:hypothetical protein
MQGVFSAASRRTISAERFRKEGAAAVRQKRVGLNRSTGSILDHISMPLYGPHDVAPASKSAAALAASKESAVPLAMTFHSPRSPVFLLISHVGTPSSVNA